MKTNKRRMWRRYIKGNNKGRPGRWLVFRQYKDMWVFSEKNQDMMEIEKITICPALGEAFYNAVARVGRRLPPATLRESRPKNQAIEISAIHEGPESENDSSYELRIVFRYVDDGNGRQVLIGKHINLRKWPYYNGYDSEQISIPEEAWREFYDYISKDFGLEATTIAALEEE